MYVSRMSFHSLPGKTHDVEQALKTLLDLVTKTAGTQARVLRTHFASLGAPDVVFEQEAQDLATLESQIQHVTGEDQGPMMEQTGASGGGIEGSRGVGFVRFATRSRTETP